MGVLATDVGDVWGYSRRHGGAPGLQAPSYIRTTRIKIGYRLGDFGGDFGVRTQGWDVKPPSPRFRAGFDLIEAHHHSISSSCDGTNLTKHALHIPYLNLLTASGKSLTVPTMLYRFLGRGGISQTKGDSARNGILTGSKYTSRQASSTPLH